MTHPQRKLIPYEKTIVVLDTSPVRNVAHGTMPAWVATFADMAQHGYSFSLADGASAELLTAHARGSITNSELATIVKAAETFLNPAVPVLLGKVDLMRMIGEADLTVEWEAEVQTLSQRTWQMLKAASSDPQKQGISVAVELQKDRDDWIGAFAKFNKGFEDWLSEDPSRKTQFPLDPYDHPYLDLQFLNLAGHSVNHHPDMAKRMDLQMRYEWRQWVRSRQVTGAYNPASKKKINDGVDLDMYSYLMLPALVVAGERGFHSRINDIKSPQLNWIWNPEGLADAWTRGERPSPAWAAVGVDKTTSQHAE